MKMKELPQIAERAINSERFRMSIMPPTVSLAPKIYFPAIGSDPILAVFATLLISPDETPARKRIRVKARLRGLIARTEGVCLYPLLGKYVFHPANFTAVKTNLYSVRVMSGVRQYVPDDPFRQFSGSLIMFLYDSNANPGSYIGPNSSIHASSLRYLLLLVAGGIIV